MKRRNFQDWEKVFLLLNYPLFRLEIIAKYLNRSVGSLRYLLSQLNCKKKTVYKDRRFGKLMVKGIDRTEKGKGKIWRCVCDCGNETFVSTKTLNIGHSQSCGCGRIEAISRKVGQVNGQYFSKIKQSARIRNIEFKLTKEFLCELLEKQNYKCALTGLPIEIVFGNQAIGSTASLDRIDSKGGYTEDNVQFLHKDVNFMKQEYDQLYFITICNMIANKFHVEENQWRVQ